MRSDVLLRISDRYLHPYHYINALSDLIGLVVHVVMIDTIRPDTPEPCRNPFWSADSTASCRIDRTPYGARTLAQDLIE